MALHNSLLKIHNNFTTDLIFQSPKKLPLDAITPMKLYASLVPVKLNGRHSF